MSFVNFDFERAVPSGVVTMVEAFFTSMRLQEVLDEMLPYDEEQCKLTPGQRLLGLTLCVFGGREALYRVLPYPDQIRSLALPREPSFRLSTEPGQA